MENTPEKNTITISEERTPSGSQFRDMANCKFCNVLVEVKSLEEEMCSTCCLFMVTRRKELAKESAVERYSKQSQMLIILGVIGRIRKTNENTTFIWVTGNENKLTVDD